MALPPKGHAPAVEETALLERIDIRIAEERGVKVVGIPIGTEEYLERAMGVVTDARADRLA